MCRYQPISVRVLDSAPLLGCPCMLPLRDVAFDDDPLTKNLTPALQKVILNDVNYQKMA